MKNQFCPIFMLAISFLTLYGCRDKPDQLATNTTPILHTENPPIIDGLNTDTCWTNIDWLPINEKWIGPDYAPADFTGNYKLRWDTDFIYIITEIRDDHLVDIYPDGLNRYWDDDCVEVFIDEDRSKGDHLKSYNAFAYHVGLDYKVVDFGIDEMPHYYNDHIETVRTKIGDIYTWEMKMKVFDDTFVLNQQNTPVNLTAGKEIGFAIAYCDNDNSESRENFIGSIFIPGEDKNQGYKDAGVFGSFTLIK